MSSCEQYKKVLKDRIENIMISGFSDINSLEEICKLIDTWCKIDKYSKVEYDEYEENEMMMDNEVYEMKNDVVKHYHKYMEYKDKYKSSGNLDDKMKMLEHLDEMIKCMGKMFEDIVNKAFDCQEEKMAIKDFLQKTYRIVS